jgi:hypothetical protein
MMAQERKSYGPCDCLPCIRKAKAQAERQVQSPAVRRFLANQGVAKDMTYR